MSTQATEYYGTGKRKTSVARVHLRPGSGEFKLNDRSDDEYFGGHETLKMIVRQPFGQLVDECHEAAGDVAEAHERQVDPDRLHGCWLSRHGP